MAGEPRVNPTRRDTRLSHLRIVMVSSYTLDHLKARHVAVDAYVQKPYRNYQLVDAVDRMIGAGASRRHH